MKALFVDQYAQMGGGQRILLDIVENFKESGIECMVALPETGQLTELLKSHSVAVCGFTLPKMEAGRKGLKDQLAYFPAALRASRELKSIAQGFEPDLIFCNGPRCALPCVLAASSLKLPVICAVHLIFGGQEQKLLSWCFKRKWVKAITFCSTIAAKAFPKLPKDRKTLVGNWVSPKIQNQPRTENAKAVFELQANEFVVGVVGRLSQKKGQRLFLEAMAPLAHLMPNLRLLIAGSSDFEDPEEENHLHAIAKDLGLSYHVRFLGTVENTAALMDALDVLVVPSVWEEPFGLVAVEGMARSLPVVACRSGGLVDIVEDGETGFLVEKKAEDIRKAVKCLITNPELRAEMGVKGLERARTEFSAADHLEELRNLARNLLNPE
jgi:glycosyltransferase involved in cell wall biosynthesis